MIMQIPRLYIIAGCNGAGKTTASLTFLPQLVNCREFVNADEIAKGLNPLNPEEMAIPAGRIMLERIDKLLAEQATFAIETTLATRSYHNLVKKAIAAGYEVTLVFIYLASVELAMQRVQLRVESGGHNIPADVIRRRYTLGLNNLNKVYLPIVSHWLLIDNTMGDSSIIATDEQVIDEIKYKIIIGGINDE